MDSSLVPIPQNEDVCARCWVLKRSRWLQQWRHRLLVLTPTCLSFFCSQSEDECPTEQFWINTLGAVQPIDADQLEIETAQRQVRIEVPDGQRDRVISAIVNARLHYIPAVAPQVHVFEPVDKVGLQERYALCNNRALGRGAFGSVWRAKCLQSGRHVAIKEIELPQSTRETMRKLVLREVSLMRQVDHPHVVCLLNYFESPRAAYLVMELLPGGDLFAQVAGRFAKQQHSAYCEHDVVQILRMALGGLNALHEVSIVHRDIKPENVLLLDRRGGFLDLRIADLGLAQQLAPGESCSDAVGTWAYMAPEVHALSSGLPADIWSMGVLLFTLLVGTPPWSRSGAGAEAPPCPSQERWACCALRRQLQLVLQLTQAIDESRKGLLREAAQRELRKALRELSSQVASAGPFEAAASQTLLHDARSVLRRARRSGWREEEESVGSVGAESGQHGPAVANEWGDSSSAAPPPERRDFAWTFDDPNWEWVSDEAKLVVSLMLQPDPGKRPSAAQLLQHPWLQPKRRASVLQCERAAVHPFTTARQTTLLPPKAPKPVSPCLELDGSLGTDVPFTLGKLSSRGGHLGNQPKAARQPWPKNDLHGFADVAHHTRAAEKFLVPRSSTAEKIGRNTELVLDDPLQQQHWQHWQQQHGHGEHGVRRTRTCT